MPVAKPKLPEATEAPPRRDAGRGADVANPDRAVTLAEAAEMLGISQTFINRLVDHEVISHHMVGNDRRVKLRDVLEYKKVRERGNKAMDFIVAESQRLGLYPKP